MTKIDMKTRQVKILKLTLIKLFREHWGKETYSVTFSSSV